MTDFIIIGSCAIKRSISSFREPRDTDILCTERINGYDCIVVPKRIIDLCVLQVGTNYADIDTVYTIKCSHLGWDLKWSKHKNDALYLKAQGCKLIEPLYSELVAYWKETNGNKPHLSLYKKKGDFFNDFVTYVYDHDYLHELVAYPNKPIYTKCLKENETVAIDKCKFDRLSFDEQIRMFKEEITVIASERWLIPPKVCGKYSWMEAYSLALHKTVTRLTKNWACDFIIQHLEYFVKPEKVMFQEILKLREGEKIMAKQLSSIAKEALLQEIALQYNTQEVGGKYYTPFDLEDLDTSTLYSEIIFEGNIVELLDQHGGEGQGDEFWGVFKFQDKIYRASTWYASNNGVEWSDMEICEVKPVEKVVTVYE